MSYSVGKERFEKIIQDALQLLPPAFQEIVETLRIEVRERPTRRMLLDADVPRGHTLLGLYQGRAITRRSVEDSGAMPDVIYLFQAEIERLSDSEEDLVDEVRRTLLHEIGHHFGLDEEDLDELGYG